MKLNPIIQNVTDKIQKRSEVSRESYINRMNAARKDGPKRAHLTCGNQAHAYAPVVEDQERLIEGIGGNIGIINAYNDMLSAHQPFQKYPDIIKKVARLSGGTAQVAAGVPSMCDGITQGQTGMELSLFSRDAIAMSAAIGLSHNVFDTTIYLGVCDKIVPGMVISAATFGHLPAIFLPAGPMPTGQSNDEKAKIRQDFAEGKADRSDLMASEMASYHGPGTCTFYGTANTNQLIMEVMGLQLPSSSFVSPESDERQLIIDRTVQSVLNLKSKGMKTGEMLNAKSWVNGIVGLIASGGSTNLTIHLIAMAEAGGFSITLEDMNELSSIVPTITNVYPNGSADVNEFHQAGGVAAFIGSLLDGGFLFSDVETLIGNDLNIYRNKIEIKNNELVWETPAKILDQTIIRDTNNPFNNSGGLKLMEGNIGRGIIKTSSLKSSSSIIKSKSLVFNTQEDVLEAFGLGKLNRDCIIVVRGQGPSANGMPELHKLTSPLNVLQSKGYTVAIITDGRMSGASGSVPAVIHITPEANAGGLIGKIKNNDEIIIDISNGTFDLQVGQETLNSRMLYKASNNSEGIGRELFKSFRENVKSVDAGASIF